jgi:hypothetical protein
MIKFILNKIKTWFCQHEISAIPFIQKYVISIKDGHKVGVYNKVLVGCNKCSKAKYIILPAILDTDTPNSILKLIVGENSL